MNSTEPQQPSFKLNSNDPKQLKKIIQVLIGKSKTLISSLQQALAKLQKTQAEKQFWKNSYYSFKEGCQVYLESKGVEPYQYIANLKSKIKKLNFENQFLNDSLRVKESRVTPVSNLYISPEKRQKKQTKLSSTLSFGKQSPANIHKLTSKRISNLKIATNRQKQKQINSSKK